jgi:hypothetical protein
VYISLEMLGLPGEMLESESITLDGTATYAITFRKGKIKLISEFSFETIISLSGMTPECLVSKWEQNILVITVVDEPLEPFEQSQRECIDLGYKCIQLSEFQEGKLLSIDIPLSAKDGEVITLAKVELLIIGLENFHNYIKEHEN